MKPSSIDWGYGSASYVIEPSDAVKNVGWYKAQKPPFQYMNWIHNETNNWVEYAVNRIETIAPTLIRSSASITWNGTQIICASPIDVSFRVTTGEQINRIPASTYGIADGFVFVLKKDKSNPSPVTVTSGTYGTLGGAQYAIVDEDTLTDTDHENESLLFRRRGSDLEVLTTGMIYPSGSTINLGSIGVTDHGGLSGLGDNDHPQYSRIATNETISGLWTFGSATAFSAAVSMSSTLSVAGNTTFDSGTLYVDATNNRVYAGATSTNTIDSTNAIFQIYSASATALQSWQTDSAGVSGVIHRTFANSSSPAASDSLYSLLVFGRDSVANEQLYSGITHAINDTTSGSEDAYINLNRVSAGVYSTALQIGSTQNTSYQDLSLNGNNITSVGLVDGVDVSAHTHEQNRDIAFGTTNIAVGRSSAGTTTSTMSTAITKATTGTVTYYMRSHGGINQMDWTLGVSQYFDEDNNVDIDLNATITETTTTWTANWDVTLETGAETVTITGFADAFISLTAVDSDAP